MIRVAPIDETAAAVGLDALWPISIGPAWATSGALICAALPQARWFAATTDTGMIGLCAIDLVGESAVLLLILVAPAWQRRGIGRQLLSGALAVCRPARLSLAQTGRGHLWPGVPLDLPRAIPFFRALGFAIAHEFHDLIAPAPLPPRVVPAGWQIGPARAEETMPLLNWVAAEFSAWTTPYAALLKQGRLADILLARDPAGQPAGCVMALPPDPRFRWQPVLGPHMGELACIGVTAAQRSRGLGAALVTAASAAMARNGARQTFIGWTHLAPWYQSLGAGIWRSYAVMQRHAHS